jgi:branched-chain amino acid aminotransferase
MKVVLNKELIDESKASISIWDRGFLLGDGIFETLKFADGQIEFLEEHWSRLKNSSEVTGINIPLSQTEAESLIRDLVKANELDSAAIRLTLSRGVAGSGLSAPKDIVSTLLITATQVPDLSKAKSVGIKVVSYKESGVNKSQSLGAVKATNYLINILAKRYAEEQGADEALFTDHEDNALELTTANLFYSKGSEIYTTPIEKGVLPGITRQKIMESLGEKGVVVKEKPLNLNEISEYDEFFMSSSVRGMVPISEIDGEKFAILGESYQKAENALADIKKKTK